ncbi:MAG TPA: nucleotide exchange factor GrpE [Blastocatellia bacterium]|nr:nucleotide exchange factor GrpE [Blastocatellia bacterium]
MREIPINFVEETAANGLAVGPDRLDTPNTEAAEEGEPMIAENSAVEEPIQEATSVQEPAGVQEAAEVQQDAGVQDPAGAEEAAGVAEAAGPQPEGEAQPVAAETESTADVKPEAPPAEPGEQDTAAQLSKALAQIDTLTQERSTLYDQLLRRQAEFENFRKRQERERVEHYNRLRADLLLDLLPVLDNFERALVSLDKSGDDAQALGKGVELIHKQFTDALTKLGLQAVESLGHPFDPNLHEAITVEPTDEHEENTIIEEFQRGYKLGDRLLRPARVKVAGSPER